MDQVNAIVVVRDAILASSLELALQAGGVTPVLYDPAQALDDLPLEGARTLIFGPHVLNGHARRFLEQLRARPWDGLVILITGDGESLRGALATDDRLT